MKDNECLHAGHRERMIDKFYNNPDGFSDHEILEMILFFSIPRRDTNEIAHRLLHVFGSLGGVFTAKPKELTAVSGVGKKVASDIALIGKLLEKITVSKKEQTELSSFYNLKEIVCEYFKGMTEEQFLVLFLDKKFKETNRLFFADGDLVKVCADGQELATALAIHRPTYMILAHNHPSGKVSPSNADDSATMKINVLCSLHGVNLIDHVIVSGNNIYSYHMSKRMEFIKEKSNIDGIINNIKENVNNE